MHPLIRVVLKKMAIWTSIFFAMVLATMLVVEYMLGHPEVFFSNETGECVEVQPAEAGSCSELPKKYLKTWVK